jgi:tetratricopeptide (TPR) repeat protein
VLSRLIAFLAPAVLFGAWTELRFGPFEVLTQGNEKQAREVLNYMEQLRHTAATLVGVQEIEPQWPVRIVMAEGRRAQVVPELAIARDAYVASITAIQPQTAASLAQVFLESWPGYMPPNLRRGLVQLLSTLEVTGTRVTLGAVPAQKDRDWSRAHMLAVSPEYSGKLRVLLGNLGRGVDADVAYRNAFQKSAQEIERELDRYIETGNYGTIPLSGKPINAQRQFFEKEVDDSFGMVAVADVLLTRSPENARTAYEAVLKRKPDIAEAREGIGLAALLAGRRDEAAELLKAARSARPLVERSKLVADATEKKALLTAAATANPRWAEPHRLIAALEVHPAQKLASMRAATQLDPRDSATWITLAELQEANSQFADAAKSWTMAERSTDDPAARTRIREARAASEQRRIDQQIAAREEARRKAEQELNDLRNRALLEIRKAEARANEGKPVIDPRTLDEYKEGPQTVSVTGVLQRVDCMGSQARLHIASGRQITRILVRDAGHVEIAGGGERSFSCGVQKPARSVRVDYVPKTEAPHSTVGEAVKIEFR